MPGSRALKGIASGLVETFVSRNNDVFGYWGIGQLRNETEDRESRTVELDLLSGETDPKRPVASNLIVKYSGYLSASLVRAGFPLSRVIRARILVEFGSFGDARDPDLFSTLGEPFNCKAVLVGTSGKAFSAVRGGLCRRHDARCEQQSMRPSLHTEHARPA